jgi:GDPmannose 4,6-dehydratase
MPVQDSRRPEELITGVVGQDGAYLAEYPLGLGCTEHSVKRRSFSVDTARADHLYQDLHTGNVPMMAGDLEIARREGANDQNPV